MNRHWQSRGFAVQRFAATRQILLPTSPATRSAPLLSSATRKPISKSSGGLAGLPPVKGTKITLYPLCGRDEASRNAWCRENGLFAHQLQQWKDSATQSLAAPEEARASPSQTKADRRRIKELERELRRKESALAEAAALLVLSKKTAAIFQRNMQGEDE